MRPTNIVTVAVVLALLMVAKSRTVGITEATGNAAQSTMSALDVGRAGMKNLLAAREAPKLSPSPGSVRTEMPIGKPSSEHNVDLRS
jgi:hypothetical protein